MDWQMALYLGAAGAALVGVGLAARAIRNVPTVEDDEAAAKALRDEWFPPDLQHYWVPAGANGGPDGKWWVFLGAEKTIFGFTDPLDAVAHADRLNQSELRGKYHPGRQSGVMVSVSTPTGLGDQFARRFFRDEAQQTLGIDDGPLFVGMDMAGDGAKAQAWDGMRRRLTDGPPIDFPECPNYRPHGWPDDQDRSKSRFFVAAIPSDDGKPFLLMLGDPDRPGDARVIRGYTRKRNAQAAADRGNEASLKGS